MNTTNPYNEGSIEHYIVTLSREGLTREQICIHLMHLNLDVINEALDNA